MDAELSQAFRKRRTLNWLLAGTMYAFFYMARYNFVAVNARLADLYGWKNTEIGVITSIGSLVYGVSVFLNGPLADRIGGRKAILIGAAGTTVFNVVFGLGHLFLATPASWQGEGKLREVVTPAVMHFGMTGSSVLAFFTIVWACNYYFQSFGALSIVKINAAWFHVRERGFFSGIFGILIRGGLLLAFAGVPFIAKFLPWQWIFWVPALCVGALFVANYLFVRDTPADAGFPEVETGAPDDNGPRASVGAVLKKVLANPTMWTIALGSMMIGFVRRSAVDDWWVKYFVNVHHADAKHLSDFFPYELAAWGMAIAGVLGGLTFGWVSDNVFKSRRAPVIVFGFLGQAVVLAAFGLLDHASAGPIVSAMMLVCLSFFVNGAHGMVGGAASMDFGGKKAAATAAGLFDGMQYIAGAVVGYGMGKALDAYGWGVWQFLPIPFALLGAVLMARLWNAVPGSGGHGGAAPAKDKA